MPGIRRKGALPTPDPSLPTIEGRQGSTLNYESITLYNRLTDIVEHAQTLANTPLPTDSNTMLPQKELIISEEFKDRLFDIIETTPFPPQKPGKYDPQKDQKYKEKIIDLFKNAEEEEVKKAKDFFLAEQNNIVQNPEQNIDKALKDYLKRASESYQYILDESSFLRKEESDNAPSHDEIKNIFTQEAAEEPTEEPETEPVKNEFSYNFDPEKLTKTQKRFYDALNGAYQTDLQTDLFNTTTLLENLSRRHTVEENFPDNFDGTTIKFTNLHSNHIYEVSKDHINFVQEGDKKEFTFADALEMAKFAALDKSMQRDGIELTGSRKERALLQKAIEEINKSLPADMRLEIQNPVTSFYMLGVNSEAKAYLKQNPVDLVRTEGNTLEIIEEAVTAPSKPSTSPEAGRNTMWDTEYHMVIHPDQKFIPQTELSPSNATFQINPEDFQKEVKTSTDEELYNAVVEKVKTNKIATNSFIKAALAEADIPIGKIRTVFENVVSRLEKEPFIQKIKHGAVTLRIVNPT